MWIILWSSGGGSVSLSRCFWQHSEWALITAGLRFPPSVCPPASPSVHDSKNLGSRPPPPPLPPLISPAAEPANATWRPQWTQRRLQRRTLCNDGQISEGGCSRAAEKEDGHRRRDARSDRGENRVRCHLPNHSALPSRTPSARTHYTAADRVPCPRQEPSEVAVITL